MKSCRTSARANGRRLTARGRTPATSAPRSPVLSLRDSIGNRAFGSLLRTQFSSGGGDESAEIQADGVAERVAGASAGESPAAINPSTPVASPWIAGGQSLSEAERPRLESALGADLTNVRLFEGSAAENVAQRFDARAVTFGPHVFFGRGEHAGDRRLLAHEVAHTVQQSQPGAAFHTAAKRSGKSEGEFRFERKLERIDSLLSYNIIDWAITDAEAVEALELLESMRTFERTTAMSHINVGRLRDNLPAEYVPRLELIERETARGVADTSEIHELLSYSFGDLVITDEEAIEALELLEKLPPLERMHALMGINRRRLYENLPTPEHQMRLSEIWTDAHTQWERMRQQQDPLDPGDRLRIRVWNATGQDEEAAFGANEVVVDDDYNIDLPLLDVVNVRNLGAAHIAARLTELLRVRDLLRSPIVSVDVTGRGTESFEAEGLPITEGEQPPASRKLAPGDTLEMRILNTLTWVEEGDISGNFMVDQGGRIRLTHLGLVDAAGRTVAELEMHMAERLATWYPKAPTIWIWITSSGGRIYRPDPAARPRPVSVSSIEASERSRIPLPERREVDVYLDFVRKKQAEIATLPTKDALLEYEAMNRFFEWFHANNDETKLAATDPWAVWGRIHTPLLIARIKSDVETKVKAESEARAYGERSAAVEAKLEEYWKWAQARWAEAGVVFRSLGPAHLLTENPLRKEGMNALTNAVLSWAYSHTSDPDFLKKSPAEVALYLLASDPYLHAVVQIGQDAPPRVEYFPELDRTRYTLGELAAETIIGFIPIIGDIADALQAATGVSITGHELDTGDRVLSALGALIPFVPGSALRAGKELPEIVEQVAKTTGRSSDEVYAIFRVAGHLEKADVSDLERIIKAVNDGKKLSPADMQILDNIAMRLKGPLEEAASYLAKGKAIPIGKLRADIVTGTKFIPGTEAHKAQRWIEYQFRNPGKFSKITGKVDPAWEALYDGIIKNKRAGGVFEEVALKHLKHEKNVATMIPPGGKAAGFIPDAVKGNPAELVWGQAYHFAEVKAWKDMSYTGNLKAMLEYVDDFGGHIDVVFRSAKHADGATELTGPLRTVLDRLAKDGKATIHLYP
jgi:protein involved in polysaccharide export with SLBB domain